MYTTSTKAHFQVRSYRSGCGRDLQKMEVFHFPPKSPSFGPPTPTPISGLKNVTQPGTDCVKRVRGGAGGVRCECGAWNALLMQM